MNRIIQVSSTGEEHGCLKILANSEKSDGFKNMSPETKSKAEKLKKEESRTVKARYINHFERNGKLEIPYSRWGGEPISMWRLINGCEYQVPVGLVNQVNESYFNERSEKVDKNTARVIEKDRKTKQHELIIIG